jgi:3-isopropylmalate/(R)-2-methylmalate dehydratase small subunit
MNKFQSFRSTVVPLEEDNIDTDQIIPARFLKATGRTGFGENLFRDLRYDSSGQRKAEFIFNNDSFQGKILMTGKNFGCGSSREHAAWAIQDYGFEVIIAESFADIFRNNALNNGLLTLTLPEKILKQLFAKIKKNPSTLIDVNLTDQLVEILDGETPSYPFVINPYKKLCLLEGLDDIDYLLTIRDQIALYEKNKSAMVNLSRI